MSRTEDHHYTREQLEQHLDDAIAIVDERQVDDELRRVLVPQLFEKLSAKQITFTTPQTVPVDPRLLGAHPLGRI